jgi:cytochrome c
MNKHNFSFSPARLWLAAGILAVLGACGKKEEPAAPATTPPPQAETPAAVTPAAPTGPVTPKTRIGAEIAEAVSPIARSAEEIMRKDSDCFTCHAVDKKLIGPAYQWVAYRYKGDPNAVATLMGSVRNGSKDKWKDVTGGAPMNPHPNLSDEQIKSMVEWVLSQTPVAPPKS